MTTPPDRPNRRHRRQTAGQLRRDAALRRIASTRRVVLTGTVGLVAGFTGLVADLAPSYAKRTAAAASLPRDAASSQLQMPSLATPAELGLSAHRPAAARSSAATTTGAAPAPAPAAAPAPAPAPAAVPAPAPAPVVSGGS